MEMTVQDLINKLKNFEPNTKIAAITVNENDNEWEYTSELELILISEILYII